MPVFVAVADANLPTALALGCSLAAGARLKGHHSLKYF
jgi:hypothetical protein